MKKRWLSVILVVLAICMILPIVAACGGNSGTNTNTGSTNTNGGEQGGGTSNPGQDDTPGSAQVLETQSAPSIKYLRIAEIGANSTTIKFNLAGTADS